MDKNSVTGTILMAVLLFAFLWYNSQQQEQLEQSKPANTEQSLPEKVEQSKPDVSLTDPAAIQRETETFENVSDSVKDALIKQQFGDFSSLIQPDAKEELVTLQNDLISIELSTKGAGIHSLYLKEFLSHEKDSIYLIEPDNHEFNLLIPTKGGSGFIDLAKLTYQAGKVEELEDGKSISFKAFVGSNDSYIEHKYTLSNNSYLFNYQINTVNVNSVIPSNTTRMQLNWNQIIHPLEQNLENERRYSSIYYRFRDDDVELLSTSSEDDNEDLDAAVDWISFKQQFFNTSFITDGKLIGKVNSHYAKDDTNYVKKYAAELYIPYAGGKDNSFDFSFYAGPNDYQILKKLKNDMQNIIQYGPDVPVLKYIAVINKAFIIPIFNWLNKYIQSYGLIILILTIFIKFLLFPFTFKSYKSMAAMKVLKPELDALKEKFGGDQQKMGTEQMKLYSQAGVSPLGGCLPMLLQMPVLVAMYYFFPSSIELRQEAFLWASDLSTYDNIFNLPFTIPIYGSHVSAFTLLMTVSSVLYSMTNMQNTAGGPAGMKYMPYFFPFFLMFIFNSWPAALTYYYFLSNMITFGQQIAIKKLFINEDKLRAQIDANKKKKKGKKKSKWQQRLEDMQKKQQQVAKQRKNKK